MTGCGTKRLLLVGFNYDSILRQCCQMPVGYVQVPVAISGPLRIDGKEYFVSMEKMEGCLISSTNRGCKAIAESGGERRLRDGMMRAPVVRFSTAKWAAEFDFSKEEVSFPKYFSFESFLESDHSLQRFNKL